MRIQAINKKIIDKLLLVITAIFIACMLMLGQFVIEGPLALSPGWRDFYLISAGYIAIVLNGCRPVLKSKQLANKLLGYGLIFLVLSIVITVWALLFSFDFVSFPRSNIWIWGGGMMILSILSIFVCTELIEVIGRN